MYFPKSARSGYALVAVQCCLALVIVVGLIAAPPVSGRMLLVPVGAEGRDDLARLAVGAGARLVAPGPLGGSLIVSGDSGPLIAALMPRHAWVLSASTAGCGDGKARS